MTQVLAAGSTTAATPSAVEPVPASLRVRNATRRFGTVHALDDADLEVRRGEIVALLGPSGCGKSTLLRAVAGIERLDHGAIELDGRDVTQLAPSRRGISMVFQDGALFPHLRVHENIAVGIPGSLRSARRRRDLIEPIAHRLRISELLDRHPHQLSGGQRQRVGIARALVGSPRVVLLDEPFSSLDAELRVELRRELRRLHDDGSIGDAVFVTHDQSEATSIADRVAVMCDGRIVQVGTPVELIESPANLFVATFVGVPRINVIGSGRATLCIRPTDVATAATAPAGAVRFDVDLLGAEPFTGAWLARVRTRTAVELDVVVPWDAGARPPDTLTLAIEPDRVLAYDDVSGERLAAPDAAAVRRLLCGSG